MRRQVAFSRGRSIAGDTTNTVLVRNEMPRVLTTVSDF